MEQIKKCIIRVKSLNGIKKEKLEMTTLPGQLLAEHIVNRDLNKVSQLLQSGSVNLDERDENGQTFLMLAAQIGDLKITKAIVNQPNVDVNAVDNDNWTALLNASKEGHHAIVAYLLDYGASVDHRDIGQWTSLMWSCYKGHDLVSSILLNHGANPNVKGEHHMSCLTWAAGRGRTEIVRGLLAHEAQVNTADKYGTTPLIWASRKGFKDIVLMLLTAGANVDNSGMNSWTALLVAAKGKFGDVVAILLEYHPNVNAVDKDGYTALSWGAKEGSLEIVQNLLTHGAYVNVPDRYGDTILIHGVKGGHVEVVKALLKKYADLDVEGVDGKTALYWSVEKGHLNITRMLLDYNANTEIANKDGDTPLLKAVRGRNYDIVKLLLDKHAKVSTADKRGDTAMHIAVRSRSKRIMEQLLKNPKDGRLLYRPNKAGDTPYQLDMAHDKSILTQVFGARNLNATDTMRGYELYSSTIADVLSEPSLHTPITVGLYAKWGSGKSFLIDQLVTEMSVFTRQTREPEFEFSVLQGGLSVCISLLLGLILWLSVGWPAGVAVGISTLVLQFAFLGLLKLIMWKKRWHWAYSVSRRLAKKMQLLQLLLHLLFMNEPVKKNRDTHSVKFLFTKNARLASVVGEKSITAMICTLCESLEDEYGVLVSRLYRIFKPKLADNGEGRFKTICCIPYFVIVLFIVACVVTAVIILCNVGVHNIRDRQYTVYGSILIAIGIIVGITFLGYFITGVRMIYDVVVSPKRRVKKIGSRLDSLKMEGFMQSLKREVEIMGQLTNCMDAFRNTHTRLVVIVDGLDSCEQEKLLQVLDTLHMLFGDAGSPFITILAVDPHVIVKGIEHNLHGLFRDSSINGHDYLRNIVHLPFFLQQNPAPPRRYQSRERDASIVTENNRHTRLDSQVSAISASNASLAPGGDRKQSSALPQRMRNFGSSQLIRQPSQSDLSRSLGKNTYFSDVNPKNMKRLMNIIAVTGRLLRAHSIDFSWYKLAAWINITEQWPYRLSWMILEVEDFADECEDNMTLKNLYNRVEAKIPTSKEIEPLLEIDRNSRKLDLFLTNHTPVLTIADMKRFMPCTINVDPYLRKLIKELQRNIENQAAEFMQTHSSMLSPIPGSEGSFQFPGIRSRNVSGERAFSPNARSFPRGITPNMMAAAGGGTLPAYLPGAHLSPALIQMMSSTMGTPSPQPQPAELSKVPKKTSKGPRIKMAGGMPQERLSNMSLEGVCNLLKRLEGINKNMLAAYQTRLQDHNITGQVLSTCDLSDLKPELAMSFGDWELFRTMITILRERDAALMSSGSSSLSSLTEEPASAAMPANFQPLTSNAYESQSVSKVAANAQVEIQAPKPQYARARSIDRNTGSVIQGIQNPADIEQFKCKQNLMQPQPTQTNNVATTAQDDDVIEPEMLEVTGKGRRRSGGRMTRVDSMVTDVIHEANYLHQLMDAVGVGEDLSEEEEVEVNDEPVTIDMTEAENREQTTLDTKALLGRSKSKKKAELFSKQASAVESDSKSNYSGYSAYSAGPDEDSDTGSEKEMDLIRRRDSLKVSKKIVSPPGGSIIKSSSSGGPLSPVNSNEKEYEPPVLGQDNPASVADNLPLITADVAEPGVDNSLVQPTTNNEQYDSSVHLSEEHTTPHLSPSSSHEYLALRRLSLKEASPSAPSAFKVITPGSSQPSTRPPSCAGSTKSGGGCGGNVANGSRVTSPLAGEVAFSLSGSEYLSSVEDGVQFSLESNSSESNPSKTSNA